MKRTLVISAAVFLAACNSHAAATSDDTAETTAEETLESTGEELTDADLTESSAGYSGYGGGGFSSDDEEFDEDAARDEAEDEIASETYSGIGRPYGCTIDCSGHDAGFAYQAGRGYDTTIGTSHSPSFDEGRQAFDEAVDERVEEMRSDWEAERDY